MKEDPIGGGAFVLGGDGVMLLGLNLLLIDIYNKRNGVQTRAQLVAQGEVRDNL